MSKKPEEPMHELGTTLALHLSGEHLGDGWVLLDKTHPLLAMYLYRGMLQVPALQDVAEGVKVLVAFQPTKKSYKITDWKVLA